MNILECILIQTEIQNDLGTIINLKQLINFLSNNTKTYMINVSITLGVIDPIKVVNKQSCSS